MSDTADNINNSENFLKFIDDNRVMNAVLMFSNGVGVGFSDRTVLNKITDIIKEHINSDLKEQYNIFNADMDIVLNNQLKGILDDSDE